jgi:peptidoglycan/LPS O-acetylase OafA/YrhL
MDHSPLHHVNAIRVIAEYFVVRLHVVGGGVGADMFARELMSFFFVLNGFVMMHRHRDSALATKEDIRQFLVRRWWKIYPTFLVCWSFWIPAMIITALDLKNQCVWRLYCSIMQLFMLDCWAGCGDMYVNNSPSWYLSCLWWLWLAFAFTKDIWPSLFRRAEWWKLAILSLASTGLLSIFMEYDIFSVCTIPLMRAGEFVVGCGAACSLNNNQGQPAPTSRGGVWWYWLPLGFSLGGLVLVYSFLGMDHGMDWLCLHQASQNPSCGVWGKSPWVEASPPCYTTGEKYFNKNVMAWAVIIYTIAKAETMGLGNCISAVLGLGIFKWLNHFSLALYLGHSDIAKAVKWVAWKTVGWDHDKHPWPTDVLLATVYCLCFLLHHIIQRGVRWILVRGHSAAHGDMDCGRSTTEAIPLLLEMQPSISNASADSNDTTITDSTRKMYTIDEESGFQEGGESGREDSTVIGTQGEQ